MSCKVGTIDKRDLIKQLQASKSSIKDLFSVLLNETKGYKYQITLTIMLRKYKPNEKIEFRPIYFNSKTKTMINQKFSLQNALQKFSGLITGLTKDLAGLMNSLSLSMLIFQFTDHYQEVPDKKGLIIIKNNN